MKKRYLDMLERVFVAEINDRLPFQSKRKIMLELAAEGYIQPMTTILPGRFPVRIEGWELTHLGRLSYCTTCDEP